MIKHNNFAIIEFVSIMTALIAICSYVIGIEELSYEIVFNIVFFLALAVVSSTAFVLKEIYL